MKSTVTPDPSHAHIGEPTLGKRMDKLEEKFEAMQSDMSEVKSGVRQLTNALTGDGMNKGVLHDLNAKIDRNTNNVHDIRTHLQSIESRIMTSEQVKDTTNLINTFKGWKLVIITLIGLIAPAMLILDYIKP